MGCIPLPFLLFFGVQLSAWLVVCTAVDRCIQMYRPAQSSSTETQSTHARRMCWTVVVVLLILNAPVLVSSGFIYGVKPNQRFCRVPDVLQQSILSIFASIYCFIPGSIILIVSLMIIHRIKKIAVAIVPATTASLNIAKKSRNVTFMLMAIVLAFLVLTLPLNLYLMLQSTDLAPTSMAMCVVQVLGLLNHAVNFPLYCLSSVLFRREFRQLLRNSNPHCCATSIPS